jgi:hypothetical protein
MFDLIVRGAWAWRSTFSAGYPEHHLSDCSNLNPRPIGKSAVANELRAEPGLQAATMRPNCVWLKPELRSVGEAVYRGSGPRSSLPSCRRLR